MKRFLLFITTVLICGVAFAQTIRWHVGDTVITTTTCESGNSITPPTAPTKYGYHFKAWEARYQLIEYIEGTQNTQYTDTGIIPSPDMNIYTKFQLSKLSDDYYNPLGARSGAPLGFAVFINNSILMLDWFGKGDNSMRWSTSLGTINNDYIFELFIQNNVAHITKNGIIVDNHTFTPVDNTFYTIFLNGLNNAGSPDYRKYSQGRIYHFVIDGIADMRPARRLSDGAIGMYDMIRNQFFTNAGTGDFIAGPVIGSVE